MRPSHYPGGITPGGPVVGGGSTPSDNSPLGVSFATRTNVALDTLIASNTINIYDFDVDLSFTFNNGAEVRINGGSWLNTSPQTIPSASGVASVQLRVNSSEDPEDELIIAGLCGVIPYTWSVTTNDGESTHYDLALENITFLGWKKFQNPAGITTNQDFGGDGALLFGSQIVTGRRYGAGANDIKIFASTRSGGILEYDFGASAPNLTWASAPTMPLHRDWGYPFAGTYKLGSDSYGGDAVDTGLYFDTTTSVLWGSYGWPYVPTGDAPNIHAAKLNLATGAALPYGPWRTNVGGGHTRGPMWHIPEDFATEFLDGKRIGLACSLNSGTAWMSHGLGFHAMEPFDPASIAAGSIHNSTVQINTHTLMINDSESGRPNVAIFDVCGWNVLYDCRAGTNTQSGNGLWSVGVPTNTPPEPVNSTLGENNGVCCGSWIRYVRDNGDVVEGMLYFGFLSDTPPGYVPPNGQLKTHMWYGDSFHSDPPPYGSGDGVAGFANQHCCHMQGDEQWLSTGPGSHYKDRKVWIETRAKMAQLATGEIDTRESFPAHVEAERMALIHAQFDGRQVFNRVGSNSWFDEQEGLLIITQKDNPTPRLGVFKIS